MNTHLNKIHFHPQINKNILKNERGGNMNTYTCYYNSPLISEKLILLKIDFQEEQVYFSSDNIIDNIDILFGENESEKKNMIDIMGEVALFTIDIMKKYSSEPSDEYVIGAMKSDISHFMSTMEERFIFIEFESKNSI